VRFPRPQARGRSRDRDRRRLEPFGFAGIAVDGTKIDAGAAALDLNVAHAAAEAGITGLEFLVGIPGTIGGALRMNAGAYDREMKDVVVSAEAVDGKGARRRLAAADLGFTYRQTAVPEDWIFLGAALLGAAGEREVIAARMREIAKAREQSQPVRTRTGGSTFKNPPGESAWRLIDKAGCRGLRVGGAMVSEMHCNFLVNTGGATAADIESLGEEVRRRVREETGVSLEWEIKRIGIPAADSGRPR
jgi:UDP-N-acetylmuramate dehydrogenase